MKKRIEKFNSHSIAEFLSAKLSRLSDYAYVKSVQSQIGGRTLDVVVLLEKHSNEIPDIFTLTNHQFSINSNIETFFRSSDGKSFLFPAGVNVHFTTPEKFATYRDEWNVVGGVCEAGLIPLFRNEFKDIGMEIMILDDEHYRSMDKEINSYWNKH
jgi:hypothetical protein